ncbi:unnamed protein product, partial [Candidula unifasciata]
EWYSYHFPELVKIVNDNYMFAKLTGLIGDRTKLTPEMESQIEEVVMDSAKARAIMEAAKSSMGIDIGTIDLINIQMFSKRVLSLADYRKTLADYLHNKMVSVAPNLAALIGEQVGARLISHAGSLTNLAKYPASTVQILGAEKALFRALKTRGNTPKYGLIFHSTFIGRAGAKNKGRISRYLANKCSIASRVDNFSDVPTSVIGEHLRQQVEDRLKFYETGENPAKNIDVMRQAVVEAQGAREKALKVQKKLDKKEKKRKQAMRSDTEEATADDTMNDTADLENGEPPKKKKKKKKSKGELDESAVNSTLDDSQALLNDSKADGSLVKKNKKKKKGKHEDSLNGTQEEMVEVNNESPKKSKKKKNKAEESMDVSVSLDTTQEGDVSINKKKKKKRTKSENN